MFATAVEREVLTETFLMNINDPIKFLFLAIFVKKQLELKYS